MISTDCETSQNGRFGDVNSCLVVSCRFCRFLFGIWWNSLSQHLWRRVWGWIVKWPGLKSTGDICFPSKKCPFLFNRDLSLFHWNFFTFLHLFSVSFCRNRNHFVAFIGVAGALLPLLLAGEVAESRWRDEGRDYRVGIENLLLLELSRQWGICMYLLDFAGEISNIIKHVPSFSDTQFL